MSEKYAPPFPLSVDSEDRCTCPGNGGNSMRKKACITDTERNDGSTFDELAGILTAISIVSKRLAVKISAIYRGCETSGEGGIPDGQDE
jgi:hypothetical protein